MVGLAVMVLFVLLAVAAPLIVALRSHRHELERGAQAAVVGALAGHRRGRPRRAGPRHPGRARLAQRRRGLGSHRARSACRLACWPAIPAAGSTRLSRIVDAMLAVPFLILAIALAAFLGPSLTNAMIAIGVTATPIFVRLTRGQTLAAKVEDYVEAARAVGNPHWRIALRHVLPNIVPPLLVQASLSIAGAIIAEAALSFLGLGPAAAVAVMGQHAERRPALPHQRVVDGDLAGLRDLPGGAVVQSFRRRVARRAGPEERSFLLMVRSAKHVSNHEAHAIASSFDGTTRLPRDEVAAVATSRSPCGDPSRIRDRSRRRAESARLAEAGRAAAEPALPPSRDGSRGSKIQACAAVVSFHRNRSLGPRSSICACVSETTSPSDPRLTSR